MNVQHLIRDTTKSKLRTSIVAPEGFKIVAADSAQIEARLVSQLCGQTDLSGAFRNGEDVYASFAARVQASSDQKRASQPQIYRKSRGALIRLWRRCASLLSDGGHASPSTRHLSRRSV